MIDMNTTHSGFDFSMEVLTFVPPVPGEVVLHDVVSDLKTAGQGPVVNAIKDLRRRGFPVRMGNRPGIGRVAYVAPDDWPEVRASCENYAEHVWSA